VAGVGGLGVWAFNFFWGNGVDWVEGRILFFFGTFLDDNDNHGYSHCIIHSPAILVTIYTPAILVAVT